MIDAALHDVRQRRRGSGHETGVRGRHAVPQLSKEAQRSRLLVPSRAHRALVRHLQPLQIHLQQAGMLHQASSTLASRLLPEKNTALISRFWIGTS
jgi:hypothetical protein